MAGTGPRCPVVQAPPTHSRETKAQSGVQVLLSVGCVDTSARAHTRRLCAQGAALGGRCSWCIKMDFRGCMGEALIILPAQLASWGVAAGGMGGTPSGADSSRLARRRVGASAGGQYTPGACSAWPPHCMGGRGPGRLLGLSQARVGATSVRSKVARPQPCLDDGWDWMKTPLKTVGVGAVTGCCLGPPRACGVWAGGDLYLELGTQPVRELPGKGTDGWSPHLAGTCSGPGSCGSGAGPPRPQPQALGWKSPGSGAG